MSQHQVRMGLIGCGGIASRHLHSGYQALAERGADNFTISATCDVRKEMAEDYADRIAEFQGVRPRAYGSIEEMLKVEDLDGVDICTPHAYHHSSAIPCLESGVNVMIEKPFGISIKASKKIIETAEKNGLITATAEQCRREIGQRAARWALNEGGIIGEPRMFYAQSARWFAENERAFDYRQQDWREEKRYSGGGIVLDKGAHMMDTIRYFFGDVDRVYGEVRLLEERFIDHPERGRIVSDSEDTFVAVITFKSGLVGTWSYSDSAAVHSFDNVLYYGSEGVIRDYGRVPAFLPFNSDDGSVERVDGAKYTIPELREMYLASLDADERERLFPFGLGTRPYEDGFALEVYDFINAIRDGRPPETDGWTGLQAKAISIAIYESAYSGQSVSVADVIDGKVYGYQREIDELWGL